MDIISTSTDKAPWSKEAIIALASIFVMVLLSTLGFLSNTAHPFVDLYHVCYGEVSTSLAEIVIVLNLIMHRRRTLDILVSKIWVGRA